MTYPTPGTVLLSGHEDERYTESFDHVEPTEYGVRCHTREDIGDDVKHTVEKVYYPWHRVQMVRVDVEND